MRKRLTQLTSSAVTPMWLRPSFLFSSNATDDESEDGSGEFDDAAPPASTSGEDRGAKPKQPKLGSGDDVYVKDFSDGDDD